MDAIAWEAHERCPTRERAVEPSSRCADHDASASLALSGVRPAMMLFVRTAAYWHTTYTCDDEAWPLFSHVKIRDHFRQVGEAYRQSISRRELRRYVRTTGDGRAALTR